MSPSSITMYFFKALAESAVITCVFLAVTEWLLPGSVLPYIPLPIITLGVIALCFFVQGKGGIGGSIALGVLLFIGISLLFAMLMGSGLHALAALVACIGAFILLVYSLYEKHTTLS